MSTKTTFKRIALVTVAALGMGVLTSVSPASAAAPTAADFRFTTTASATNYGIVSLTGGTAAGATLEILQNGQALIADAADIDSGGSGDMLKLVITQGSGMFLDASYTSAATAQTIAIASDSQSVTATSSNATNGTGGFAQVYFRPTAAGKVVIQYQNVTSAGVTTVVDTMTVYAVAPGAASLSGALSVGDSFISKEATGQAATDNVDNSTSALANGAIGYVGVALRDSLGGNVSSGSIVATATNGALVNIGADPTSTSTSQAVAAGNGSSTYVSVKQGTANKAVTTTVSITYNGTLVGVRTFTIVGDIAKIKVSAAAADGLAINPKNATTASGYLVWTYDAADNQIGYAVSVDSSKYTTLVTAQTVTSPTTTASAGVAGGWTCADASGSTPLRVKATNALGVTIYSNEFTAACGGSVDKYTATLDKASYVPGDIATLTIKAVDSKAAAVKDAATVGTGVAIAGSNLTAVTAPAAADTFTWGTKTYKFIVGATAGSYALSVDLPAYAATDSAKTVAYKITGGSATLESVLAAIVKLIAAINKQIAQLAKKK